MKFPICLALAAVLTSFSSGAFAAETTDKGVSAKGSGIPSVKIGEVVGPIDAGGDSHYFLYVPKSLKEGRKAPLLHFNGSGGGSAASLSRYIAGAETNGWIVVANVESRNEQSTEQDHQYAKNVVTHAIGSLPVDPARVYFAGNSGGGAMSFYNASRIPSIGAMPEIGYIPKDTQVPDGHYFVINGTNDFNRYTSANAVASIGGKAIQRFFVGGHDDAPDWLCAEGMAWLNGKYLAGKKQDKNHTAECLDYEISMLRWIDSLEKDAPHRAYYWCLFLRDDYGISGSNAEALSPITARLALKPGCAAYVKGIAAISGFSGTYYAPLGRNSRTKHITPEIESAAKKLEGEYSGVPMIEELARALGKPTV